MFVAVGNRAMGRFVSIGLFRAAFRGRKAGRRARMRAAYEAAVLDYAIARNGWGEDALTAESAGPPAVNGCIF